MSAAAGMVVTELNTPMRAVRPGVATTDVQHQLRGVTGGSAAAVGPAVAAGLVTARAAAEGSAGAAGAAGGAGPILAEAT